MKRHHLVDALIAARKQRGWSQAMLARRLNRTPRAVCHFETDPGGRNLAVIEEIARALGMRLALVPIEQEQRTERLREAS